MIYITLAQFLSLKSNMNSSQIASDVSHWLCITLRSIHDFEVRFAAKYPTFNVALWVIQLYSLVCVSAW